MTDDACSRGASCHAIQGRHCSRCFASLAPLVLLLGLAVLALLLSR